jgi:hypothetical protein
MMVFQNLELYHLKALACIILQSIKASSSLANVIWLFLSNYLQSTILITPALKSKILRLQLRIWLCGGQWNHGLRWWWRFHCNSESIYIGLTTNVVQWFQRRILRVNHKIYNGSGEVSCIFFLSHVNGFLFAVTLECCWSHSKVERPLSSPVLGGRLVQ